MLVLSRNIGEAICINDDIRIVLLATKGNQTRIGIDAPKDTAVNREEIYKRIQEQKAGLADDSEKEK